MCVFACVLTPVTCTYFPPVAEQRQREASTENTSLKVTSQFALRCFVLHITPSLRAPLHSCNLPLLSLLLTRLPVCDVSQHAHPAECESCISQSYTKPQQMFFLCSCHSCNTFTGNIDGQQQLYFIGLIKIITRDNSLLVGICPNVPPNFFVLGAMHLLQ